MELKENAWTHSELGKGRNGRKGRRRSRETGGIFTVTACVNSATSLKYGYRTIFLEIGPGLQLEAYFTWLPSLVAYRM